MIQICCRCKKKYGEKRPYKDKTETTGFCHTCFATELAEIKKLKKKIVETRGGVT